jgi:ArsR family transcriptional regulator
MYEGKKITEQCQEQDCSDIMNLPEEVEESLRQRGGMDAVRSAVPDRQDLGEEARVFQALSEPIRLQIVHALSVCDLCPCVLKEVTDLSDSRLSYHLNILEKAGLIGSVPQKRWRIYSLTALGRAFVETWTSEGRH